MGSEEGNDRLLELTEEFRWKLRHIEGPLNEAEIEEMEAEFDEILALCRSDGSIPARNLSQAIEPITATAPMRPSSPSSGSDTTRRNSR